MKLNVRILDAAFDDIRRGHSFVMQLRFAWSAFPFLNRKKAIVVAISEFAFLDRKISCWEWIAENGNDW